MIQTGSLETTLEATRGIRLGSQPGPRNTRWRILGGSYRDPNRILGERCGDARRIILGSFVGPSESTLEDPRKGPIGNLV